MKPTEKQLEFAQKIADEFGVDVPDEDRQGLSSWISGLADAYYKRLREKEKEERGKRHETKERRKNCIGNIRRVQHK